MQKIKQVKWYLEDEIDFYLSFICSMRSYYLNSFKFNIESYNYIVQKSIHKNLINNHA